MVTKVWRQDSTKIVHSSKIMTVFDNCVIDAPYYHTITVDTKSLLCVCATKIYLVISNKLLSFFPILVFHLAFFCAFFSFFLLERQKVLKTGGNHGCAYSGTSENMEEWCTVSIQSSEQFTFPMSKA